MIVHPRSHTIQAPFDELKSDIISSGRGNELVYVRSVPLPVGGMTAKNDLSLIETINLLPINTEFKSIFHNDIKSIIPPTITQTEPTTAMGNTIRTASFSYLDEIPVDKPRKKLSKRKRLPSIHVKIRNSSK